MATVTSKEGPLARYAVSARIPIIASCNRSKRNDVHWCDTVGLEHKVEQLQPIRRPAVSGRLHWRFTHDNRAALPDERRCTFGGDTGRAEAPSDHKIKLVPQVQPATRFLRPQVENSNTSIQPQSGSCFTQERCTSRTRLDETPTRRRPFQTSQDERRNTPAGSQIERSCGCGVYRCSHSERMAYLSADGHRA